MTKAQVGDSGFMIEASHGDLCFDDWASRGGLYLASMTKAQRGDSGLMTGTEV